MARERLGRGVCIGCTHARESVRRDRDSVGYQRSWEDFPWLMAVESDSKVTGMLCNLCKRHNTKNKYDQSTVLSTTP